MNLDRNTIIGFVILGVLFVGYFLYTSNEQQKYKIDQAKMDSIANASRPKADPAVVKADSLHADSVAKTLSAGQFVHASNGAESIINVDNDLFTVVFTNKGAMPKSVILKKYKTPDGKPVVLSGNDFDKISYPINTDNTHSAQTENLYFAPAVITKVGGNTEVLFKLQSADAADGRAIEHKYIIKQGEYLMDFLINLSGANSLISQNKLNLSWQYTAQKQENDINFEKQNTQIGYVKDGHFDYHTIGRRNAVELEKPVNWVGVRQRFFNAFLIAKNNFSNGEINWKTDFKSDDSRIVQSIASLKIEVPSTTTVQVPLSMYFGPADLHTLSRYDLQLGKMVNLGQGMYAFVRPLNRYVILPVWDFLKSFISNFGWVIACLTLVIRLLISPLTYKSYLSGAKMKALRPEISKLKEKFGSDQQAISMEQMKLFREAGVNPLGGCVPALFQIPIFFALYSFFNSSVDLRGAGFLWANDLSAYDEIIRFGFEIPYFGSHVSLFTITATITSLLISLYSMSMTPDQDNPMLKYMPYIFPVFLLFIFNSLPSALTWYYTVSNIITLALQFIIQNYIIDHNKIVTQIAQNRTKVKPKSKWAERLEQMQEQQKKLKDIQQRTKK